MSKFKPGDRVRAVSSHWDGESSAICKGDEGVTSEDQDNRGGNIPWVYVDISGITRFPFRENEIKLVEPSKTDSEKARQELLKAYEAYLRITLEKALADDVAAFAEALDLDLV